MLQVLRNPLGLHREGFEFHVSRPLPLNAKPALVNKKGYKQEAKQVVGDVTHRYLITQNVRLRQLYRLGAIVSSAISMVLCC